MGFVMVVRVIYFRLLGFSALEVGLLLSFATAISAIRHITFGYLCDRYGRKPFLILGAIFSSLRMVVFAIGTDFWMLALGQGLGALGEGAGAGQPVLGKLPLRLPHGGGDGCPGDSVQRSGYGSVDQVAG